MPNQLTPELLTLINTVQYLLDENENLQEQLADVLGENDRVQQDRRALRAEIANLNAALSQCNPLLKSAS